MGLHAAAVPDAGVNLAVIPFGDILAPTFDGELASVLQVDSDPRYSQPQANALTLAAWICPLALDNAHTAGSKDQYVHFIEKAVGPANAEWAMRLYNQKNPTRHSRLSFYTFMPGVIDGNGSYMEFGISDNDETPVELGKWLFLVGQAEPFIPAAPTTTGCIVWKQDVEAKRSPGDKYGDFGVEPQGGPGPVTIGGSLESGFKGSIAHVAIWNRLLAAPEIDSIWAAGAAELQSTAMYHSYV